jgi:hypothetical protein
MRMIITLSSLGFSFAVGGGSVATPIDRLEKPADRHALLDRRSYAKEPLLDYYRHKRYYRHDPHRARGQDSGQIQLPPRRDPDGLGTTRPETPEPVVRGRLLLQIAA